MSIRQLIDEEISKLEEEQLEERKLSRIFRVQKQITVYFPS